MAKFKVVLERVETITKQGTVMVEAKTAEEARQIILADLNVDPGSYDDHLDPVETGIGDITAAVDELGRMTYMYYMSDLVAEFVRA